MSLTISGAGSNGAQATHFQTKDINQEDSVRGEKSPQASEKTAAEKFLEFARMSPAEKMRAMILERMGLTEEQLETMSAELREEVEEKIKEEMHKLVEKGMQENGVLVDVQL
jgi:TPP-dependent pyruvate/acetoin dehydrogenase alpha subunit